MAEQLPADIVQVMAGYIVHYFQGGESLSESERRAAERAEVTNARLISQAGELALRAMNAANLAKVLSKEHTVADLFPGRLGPTDVVNVRVLVSYPEGVRPRGKAASVMVRATANMTVEEVEEMAGEKAKGMDSLGPAEPEDYEILPFLPYPPRSEQ